MQLKVEGMKCVHCENRVKNALSGLGAKNVVVDIKNKTVSFEGITKEIAITEIEDLGFIVNE